MPRKTPQPTAIMVAVAARALCPLFGIYSVCGGADVTGAGQVKLDGSAGSCPFHFPLTLM
jgi:hypothetical protein